MKKALLLSLTLAAASLMQAQETAAVRFANRVYSLSGKPFMHKLVCEGCEVERIEKLPEGLQLLSRPNYKYLYGVAPEAGKYTYTVHLSNGQQQNVTLVVQDELPQPTPFMGILTWNAFDEHISNDIILKISDALVNFGLRDAGYRYMCIDDKWAEHDRKEGHLNPVSSKFPDLKKLTDSVHSKGLKIGIYSDAGDYTCSGAQPGSYSMERTDATDFVNWGFDLLKYDFCNAIGGDTPAEAELAYHSMGRALDNAMTSAGKNPNDFLFYMCEWGGRKPWEWAANTGASCWRATADTRDYWSDTTYNGGVLQNIGVYKEIWPYTGVNRWNDADMLVVGLHGTGYSSNDGGSKESPKPGLTQDEYRTNFALWCMWSSPLTLSNNITNLDGKPNSLTGKEVTNTLYQEDLDIIRNADLIALDQDPLGQCAEPVIDHPEYIVFQKDLANGDVAFSITNLSGNEKQISLDFSTLSALQKGKEYSVKDLWNGKTDNYNSNSTFTATVPVHGTAVYRMTLKK